MENWVCCVLLAICLSPVAVLVARELYKEFRMPELQVDWVFTSAFNVTGTNFSGDWNMGFTVTRPSEKRNSTLSYDNVVCSVFFRDCLVGLNYQKLPLVLGAGDLSTAVNASVVAESIPIDGRTATYMTDERSGGSVRFAVELDAYGVNDSLCFKCDGVVVNYGSIDSGAGELLRGSKSCGRGSSSMCPSRAYYSFPK